MLVFDSSPVLPSHVDESIYCGCFEQKRVERPEAIQISYLQAGGTVLRG